MWPSIFDNLLLIVDLKPSEIQDIIIKDERPNIKPIMLNIVENDIKPKLCFDQICLKATWPKIFIFILFSLLETISHL